MNRYLNIFKNWAEQIEACREVVKIMIGESVTFKISRKKVLFEQDKIYNFVHFLKDKIWFTYQTFLLFS